MNLIFFDGKFLQEEEAKVSIFDRGFLMGDGAYATLQVCDGIALFAKLHLKRLEQNLLHLGITSPQFKESLVEELISINQASSGIYRLRVIVTGGRDPAMRLPKRDYGHFLMTLKPYIVPPYSPLKMDLFPLPASTAHASFKSLAHLNRYYVMEYAQGRGLDDAVTTTESGSLLEAAFGNLAWFVEDTLFTPDPALPLHFGVTITQLLKVARKMGFKTLYAKTKLKEIPQSALFFRTNSMGGIRPVTEIEKSIFSRDIALEKMLLSEYEKLKSSFSKVTTA